MKFKSLCLSLLCGAALSANQAQALITWTGGVNNDFWHPGNWSGGAPTFGGTTTDSLLINGAGTVVNATSTSQLTMADGFNITIINSTLNFLTGFGAQGIQGLAGGGLNFLNIQNSTVSTAFIAAGITADLTASSSLRVSGANRSINSTLETSRVNLGDGSSITYTAGNTDAGLSQPQSIFRTATGMDYKTDTLTAPLTDFILTGADTTPFSVAGGGDGVNQGSFTITAVPEPTALALAGLGFAAMMIRSSRRKI